MIDRNHCLPIKRQAALAGISRGTVYYRCQPVSLGDLALMRRLDELHLEHPFAGSRMLRDLLRLQGTQVGRRHVRTLMRRMGLCALYRKPNTSVRNAAHPVFAYLLRDLSIERADQVWALDISAPCRRGLQQQEKGEITDCEPKLADFRPAVEMLPRTGGGRAKGGRKAWPFADGWVSCAERPELYRATIARSARRATTRSMVRQPSVRWKPLYLSAQPSATTVTVARSGRALCSRLEGATGTHSTTGSSPGRRPEPPGVEHAT
jgi:putative transposase